MEINYTITSSANIMSMIINFKDQDEIDHMIHVGVDFLNQKVHFLDNKQKDFDYQRLESEILEHISPSLLKPPEIPDHLLQTISDLRNGKFNGEDIFNLNKGKF
jgi:hypothetical protein